MRQRSLLTLPLAISHAAVNAAIAQGMPKVLAEESDLLGRGIQLRVVPFGSPVVSFRQNGPLAREAVTADVQLSARIVLSRYTRLLGRASALGTLELALSTGIALEGWSLRTHTEVTGHRWIERPELRVGTLALGVGQLTSAIITFISDRLSKRVDEEIQQRQPLREAIRQLPAQLARPRLVDSQLGMWLQVELDNLAVGRLTAPGSGLAFLLEATAQLNLTTYPAGEQPPPGQVPKIAENPGVAADEPAFVLTPELLLGFDAIGHAARQALIGQRFEKLGAEVIVQGLSVGPGPRGLRIEVVLRGSVSATVALDAGLEFDAAEQRVLLRSTEVHVPEGNFVFRGLIGLAGRQIAAQIERQVATQSANKFAEARRDMAARLESGTLAPGISATGRLDEFTLHELSVDGRGVLATAYLSGALTVRIDHVPQPPSTEAVV